jgi:hypothetical protein
MDNKFSLAEYASDKKQMAFLCECKKHIGSKKLTSYVSPDMWLDIAYVLVADDLLTAKEFKNLNHLAVSQWDLIREKVGA